MSKKSAHPAPSPFHFLHIDPVEQGALMAEAMIARGMGSTLLLAIQHGATEHTPESLGFLTAVEARLVGHD